MTVTSGGEYDLRLWAMLFRTAYAIKRARERELQNIGISWIQSSVLHHVKNSVEPLTPADLARLLFRRAHTISELIKRMEVQGLVKRARDLKRKNVIRVQITDKGEKLYLESLRSKVIHEILSSLDKERQDSLFTDLKELFNTSIDLLNESYRTEYIPIT
jgi:DNA-binding MarR family transcriptional regulator